MLTDLAFINIGHTLCNTRIYWMPLELKFYVYTASPTAITPFMSKSASRASSYLYDLLNEELVIDIKVGYPNTWSMDKIEKINELVKHTEFNQRIMMSYLLMLI